MYYKSGISSIGFLTFNEVFITCYLQLNIGIIR